MSLKARWRAFILPWIHKMMEAARNDPEVSYDDWKQMCANYKETVGKEYVRDAHR